MFHRFLATGASRLALFVVLAVLLMGGAASSLNAAQISKTEAANAFDGERALMYTRDVVAFGARPVGSAALEQTRQYIESTLGAFGHEVRRDEFVGTTPVGDIEMANLVVEIPAADGSTDGPVIMLAGHYDTLPTDDFDFVGANDGGSSTGMLIEFGRVLAQHAPPVPVWLVFFDGEEALVSWSDTDSRYGSKHMASTMEDAGELDDIGAMILVDMTGDADLAFPQDRNGTPWLNDILWETGAAIGYSDVFVGGVQYMEDDHLPFIAKGVAAIDLIDFNYGPGNRYWHTPDDTMDKLGGRSFQVIGETVLTALPRVAERIRD